MIRRKNISAPETQFLVVGMDRMRCDCCRITHLLLSSILQRWLKRDGRLTVFEPKSLGPISDILEGHERRASRASLNGRSRKAPRTATRTCRASSPRTTPGCPAQEPHPASGGDSAEKNYESRPST